MMDIIQANWLLILLALVIGVAIAWYIFHASRKTRVTGDRRDVLDEGAAPAARNQALIDPAPAPASTPERAPPVVPPATPAGMAGAGEAVSAAAERQQAESAAAAEGDDLTRIKGVGPKLAAQLRGMGVTGYAQIAGWDEAEIDRVDAQLGRFQGRIRRDNWVEQARLLAAGDRDGFEGKFGKLD